MLFPPLSLLLVSIICSYINSTLDKFLKKKIYILQEPSESSTLADSLHTAMIRDWRSLVQVECYRWITISLIPQFTTPTRAFLSTVSLSNNYQLKILFCEWNGLLICSFRVPMYWSFPSRHAQGYVNELEHFIAVAKGLVESSVTHQMTLAVTKIADAAEASARSGQPVDLLWKDEEIPQGYVMMWATAFWDTIITKRGKIMQITKETK